MISRRYHCQLVLLLAAALSTQQSGVDGYSVLVVPNNHRRTTTTSTTTTVLTMASLDNQAAQEESSSSSSSSSMTDNNNNNNDAQIVAALDEQARAERDAAFLAQCAALCRERNLPLQNVKNARDLSTVRGSPVVPGRLYRTGRVSDATADDIRLLLDDLNVTTLVDLRSPTELKDDATLMRPEVYANFTTLLWREPRVRSKKKGCVIELPPGQAPLKKHFWNRFPKQPTTTTTTSSKDDDEQDDLLLLQDLNDDEDMLVGGNDDDEDGCSDCQDIKKLERTGGPDRKERHFVSVMNELKYVKGTVSKVRKRDITKSLLKAPGALVSKRVRDSCKKPFLDEINGGGLPMVNDMLLRYGAPGIRHVLELVCDTNRHPIAFYCTAGKDRTGVISALILKLCGVSTEAIVQDYTLSANVYAEMNDHKAMVGALSQRNLDPKTFLGAPAYVMQDTLDAMEAEYGSVEAYLEWIGFNKEKQEALKEAVMGGGEAEAQPQS
mmetsp:Transcript_9415/g.26017  ORF Transcript_9415/g.26017 Transcript_9415/m.26017 type:complete len:495 (+) Transcript_9415:237-1721(+)